MFVPADDIGATIERGQLVRNLVVSGVCTGHLEAGDFRPITVTAGSPHLALSGQYNELTGCRIRCQAHRRLVAGRRCQSLPVCLP